MQPEPVLTSKRGPLLEPRLSAYQTNHGGRPSDEGPRGFLAQVLEAIADLQWKEAPQMSRPGKPIWQLPTQRPSLLVLEVTNSVTHALACFAGLHTWST